jgi:hypothetical protein
MGAVFDMRTKNAAIDSGAKALRYLPNMKAVFLCVKITRKNSKTIADLWQKIHHRIISKSSTFHNYKEKHSGQNDTLEISKTKEWLTGDNLSYTYNKSFRYAKEACKSVKICSYAAQAINTKKVCTIIIGNLSGIVLFILLKLELGSRFKAKIDNDLSVLKQESKNTQQYLKSSYLSVVASVAHIAQKRIRAVSCDIFYGLKNSFAITAQAFHTKYAKPKKICAADNPFARVICSKPKSAQNGSFQDKICDDKSAKTVKRHTDE